MPERDILNIDEAAELLGVSLKTFNKVLHSEDMPARKIGREWKFSRSALIAWVGSGRSSRFYRENGRETDGSDMDGRDMDGSGELIPTPPPTVAVGNGQRVRARTAGWRIEE